MGAKSESEVLFRRFCRAYGLRARVAETSWGSPMKGWSPRYSLKVVTQGGEVVKYMRRDGIYDILGGFAFGTRDDVFEKAVSDVCSCSYLYADDGFIVPSPATSKEELELRLAVRL